MKYYLLILSLFFFSCSKENSCKVCREGENYVAATILYTGPIATDGCDWVIRIGADQYYHPDKLSQEFKQNELDVEICFTQTSEKFVCGISAQQMSVIHVLHIRK